MNVDAEGSNERKVVWLLCAAAAIHVFIFAAAFPVFNQLDEGCHFDLVVRYSHGRPPRGLQPMCREASLYLLTYSSPEFARLPQNYPGGHFPTPFWAGHPANQQRLREAAFEKAATHWQTVSKLPFWTNYETSQPPLYYALAGLWWRAGQWLGFAGLSLVYWLRFLNVPLVAFLVWIGHWAAREIFSGQKLFTLGLPALIAFAPVQAFYSIQNDVLSPVCFGAAFIFLMRLWRADVPRPWPAIAAGLCLAAAFLTKLTNAPFIAVSGIFIGLKIFRLARNGTLRRSLPALLLLSACAALPAAAWLAWMKIAFGDFTGSAAKLRFITWTLKPFHQWWHHPIFTPGGLWTFLSELAYSGWQGAEIHWHDNAMDLPAVDAVYVILTLAFLAFALLGLLSINRHRDFIQTTLPHPNPLPLGEGEWSADGLKRRMIGLVQGFIARIFRGNLTLNPFPTRGRGKQQPASGSRESRSEKNKELSMNHPAATIAFQRHALWFSFGCLAAGSAFLAWLSVIYDFGLCLDPSREHPYLAEGRLLLGMMVPFLLLYLSGLNYLLRDVKHQIVKAAALAIIISFMLVSEIATDWTVFSSQYNWYHLF